MPRKRCVNIDWLEVYCLEDRQRYPMNADYFREHGLSVRERDYGTRTYREMFTIEDAHGNPFVEVRRNPASGASEFTGLMPESCHLRLVNRACYSDTAVEDLRVFMLTHGYVFQRIFRIDVCYDFEYFDSGDQPERFARRYVQRTYRKVNQCKLALVADDAWADFEWESLKWGNEKSMVSTKMYNKTKEMAAPKSDKPYIRYAWFVNGLVDDPVSCTRKNDKGETYKPDIWRVEFSMKSSARNWIVIENADAKRHALKTIPHRLSLFDSRDKLWQRFQELAHHYFHFKYREYLDKVDSQGERLLKRKDLCRDKILFKYDNTDEFMKLQQLPKASKPIHDDDILRRRLEAYRLAHVEPKIRQACDILLASLKRSEVARLSEMNDPALIELLQRVISIKVNHPERDLVEISETVRRLIRDENPLL